MAKEQMAKMGREGEVGDGRVIPLWPPLLLLLFLSLGE
jgi:hypothetical protein